MKTLLLSLLIFTSLNTFAQNSSCDGSRYYYDQFSVDTTLGVTFGNSTSIGGTNADLLLDFFEPSGDVAPERPLIIFAFGGSFVGGTRDEMHPLCQYFAERGYVCASIDYRLYDGPLFPLPDSVTMAEEVIMAVSDMKAAVRYFREDADNANMYKVDTNQIFVGGISAGGIVASHVGMMDPTDNIAPYIQTLISNNGGFSGNSSTNTQYGDQVAGVLNYSGALKFAHYIDASDPALFSVHDDQDGVVPYNGGDASIFGFPIIYMEGSGKMHPQAQTVGIVNELITIPSSTGHVSYFGTAAGTDSILERSRDFLFPIVCPQFVGDEELAMEDVDLFPNPASEYIQIEGVNEGDEIFILDTKGNIVIRTENTLIDVSALSEGVYMLKVDGQVKRFVKQ
jgi:predicted esterase